MLISEVGTIFIGGINPMKELDKLELKRFAEEESENVESSAEVEEQEQPSTTESEDLPPIPEELSDLGEEYARGAMKEWQEQQQQAQEEQEQPLPPPPVQQPQPPQVDEVTQLRGTVQQLQAQLAQIQQAAAMAMQQQQQRQQPSPPPPPRQPQLTQENIKLLEQAIDIKAMELTGLTKDDVASFEFADDGDEKLIRWKYGKEAARVDILNQLHQVQLQKQAERQELFKRQQENIANFNTFVKTEMQEPDHQQIANYAMTDYFATLSPQNRIIVRSAYDRIEKNIAEPADILLTQMYYTQAKQAFRSGQGKQPAQGKPKVQQKPPQMPRIDQASGTTNPVGDTISMKDLEKLIESGEFNKIPKKYQDYYRNTNAMFKV